MSSYTQRRLQRSSRINLSHASLLDGLLVPRPQLADPEESVREVRIAKEYLDKISALGKGVQQDHGRFLGCVEYWRRLLTLIMEQIVQRKDGRQQVQSPTFDRYIFKNLFELFPLLVLLDELFQESRDLDLMGSSLFTDFFRGQTIGMVLNYGEDFGADALKKDLGVDQEGLRF